MRTAAEALAIELQVLQFANLGASPDNGVDALAMLCKRLGAASWTFGAQP